MYSAYGLPGGTFSFASSFCACAAFSYGTDVSKGKGKLRNSVKEMSTSIHSLEQLKEAEAFSMDFVIAGHIFATDCKKDLPPRGLSFLENICDNSEVPVYAIGGMTKEREPEVMRKGASGICIMSGCMRE